MRLVAAIIALLLALPASAVAPERLGGWQTWSAWRLRADGARECFAFAVPQKSEGDYTRRGEVSVAITHYVTHRETVLFDEDPAVVAVGVRTHAGGGR